jgi:hypothetical protein
MARTFVNPLVGASQVKVTRRRVLQHDLDMYAAIAGRSSGVEPASEPTEEAVKVATAARAKPWSAAVLASYLGNLQVPRLASRMMTPEVTGWVKRVSSHALERLQEAQDRLASTRPPRTRTEEESDHQDRSAA